MNTSETFTYERSYFVKNLLTPLEIFKDTNTVEFSSFKSFIKWAIQRMLFNDCNIDTIIVPIHREEELTILKSISTEKLPHIRLYLKEFSTDILNSFNKDLHNISILIDDTDASKFKEALKGVSQESLNYFKFTQGSYRVSINSSDIDNIVYKVTDPFFTFPFFSKVEIDWDFEELEKSVTIDRLHAIIWHVKFLSINVLNRNNTSKVYWGDFLKEDNNYSKYRLQLSKQNNIKYFFLDENNLYFSRDIENMKLPNFVIDDLIGKDANEIDVKKINEIRCIVDQPCNYKYFSSWEQRYRCNKSVMEETYLCRLLNQVLSKGDIL